MSTYISTTVTSGISLTGTPQNPVTIGVKGLVTNTSNANAIYGNSVTAWDIINSGTVEDTAGTLSSGIFLEAGGTLTNAGSALIAGSANGAYIQGDGTVTNSGVIQAVGTNGIGLVLGAGGTVTNAAGGLISGVLRGVDIGSSGGTVSNFGTILNTGSTGGGLFVSAAGSMTNGTQGLIAGVAYGIFVEAAAKISNSGIIRGDSEGIRLYDDGSIINASGGLISGTFRGVDIGSDGGAVSNFGTILNTGSPGGGLYVFAAGSVTNSTKGLIAGVAAGIFIEAAATISNSGTIQGDSEGIRLYDDGSIVNAPGGLISGAFRGVDIGSGGGAVSNSGTILNGGSPGGGLYVFASASVTNNPGGLIAGVSDGVFIEAVATVANSGTIRATATNGVGVSVSSGTIINHGTVVAGANGIGIYLFKGDINNYGTITAPGSLARAVVVRYGTFINQGVVAGSVYGVELGITDTASGTGQVTALGTVIGAVGIGAAPGITAGYTVSVAGTVIGTGGTAVNLAADADNRLILYPGASFTGTVDGGDGGNNVLVIAAGTATGQSGLALAQQAQNPALMVNVGTVFSNWTELQNESTAVDLTESFPTVANSGTIVVPSSYSLTFGAVGAVTNPGTIDLALTAMVTFLGEIADQTIVFLPPGGEAVIDDPAGLAGTTIVGFAAIGEDAIDLAKLPFSGNANVAFNAALDTLTVVEGGGSATLQLDAEDYTGVAWSASSDGVGGTMISVTSGATNAAPSIAVVSPQVVQQNLASPIAGIAISDSAAQSAGETLTVTLGDGEGCSRRRPASAAAAARSPARIPPI
jgi:hypothetical protein